MSRHILILDRDQNARQAMSIALRRAGYRVSSAFDFKEALRLLDSAEGERSRWDLVVLDTEMSEGPGRKLAELLNGHVPAIPSIMVSNFSDKAFFIDMISHGHNEFIENACDKGEPTMRIWDVSSSRSGKRVRK